MYLRKSNRSIIRKSTLLTMLSLWLVPVTGSADSRLPVEPLPQALVKTEECLNISRGWGWDGTRSCIVSNTRFFGSSLPLSRTASDYSGGNLVWAKQDVQDKTVRCDNFRYSSADENYIRERYDISFLSEDTVPFSSEDANLSAVTAHLFTRGWHISQFGRLEAGLLVDFNSREFATERGYILIHDSYRRDDDDMVRRFSHCFLKDESTPLRATGNCVDYDGDGIGWSGGETCVVNTPDPDCDYSGSSHNNGWGYNYLTGQSCPPAPDTTNFVPEDRCVDIRENGWGWNRARQESCRVDEE